MQKMRISIFRPNYVQLIRNVTSVARFCSTVEIIYTVGNHRETLHLSLETEFVVMVDWD